MSLFVNGLNKLSWEQEASVGGTAKKKQDKNIEKIVYLHRFIVQHYELES